MSMLSLHYILFFSDMAMMGFLSPGKRKFFKNENEVYSIIVWY